MSRIYASLPLNGPAARRGREVARGVELALERVEDGTVELVLLDSFSGIPGAQALENARGASVDRAALAYIGDFHSSEVASTAPILGEAGLLQVAPVATFVGLEGPTLVRLSPHDGTGAAAIVDWLAENGIGALLVVRDHDSGYGAPVGAMCADAARERGLAVRSRPVWDHDEDPRDDLAAIQAVLYVGVAGSGAVGLWHELYAANPAL